jgi:bilirubin oxidase
MQMWKNEVTETPLQDSVETWEIYNFTVDKHPIHIHQVMFQVLERQSQTGATARPPEAWETGWKDTVIAYPNEITRVRLKFDLPGRYVWHCHILEHEDNEMMRPLDVLPAEK